jgi:hypothetical protein
MFIGMQAAQIWRNEEETPKRLFPNMSKTGIMRPIKGPATYHGHGCFIQSIKFIV